MRIRSRFRNTVSYVYLSFPLNIGKLDLKKKKKKCENLTCSVVAKPVADRIRIRRMRMFLSLPDLDPLVRFTDLAWDPDPSINKQK